MTKKKPKTQKYYAIKVGRNTKDKIVRSWSECKEIVNGYPSIYKSFLTEQEALDYLGSIKDTKKKLEENKKATEYNKNKKKTTTALTNVFKGLRIDNELLKAFEDKCTEMNLDKNEILIELIKEWVI